MSRSMSKKHVLAGLAAAGVLGVGIAAPTVAFAQNDPSPSPNTSTTADPGTDREQRHAEHRSEFAESLAKELGVETDKVTAALEKLREQRAADRPERGDWPGRGERGGTPEDRAAKLKERLATAVEEGKLTQDQADAITEAVESGVFPGGWGPGPNGHPGNKTDN
ncbi:hypothetical protein [Micromonospora sp. SH-82]|uniref:hypothetical protein n=1 Tax=Micromonospora sp. SH-82 TaxID=3132938 RepID=UPI003EB75D5D